MKIRFYRIFPNDLEYRCESTVGASFINRRVYHDDITIDLMVWNTVSDERFRSLNSLYYKGTSIAVLVFSLADQKSFDDAKYMGDNFKSECDEFPSIILVGNRNDLVDERVISCEQGQKTAKELMPFILRFLQKLEITLINFIIVHIIESEQVKSTEKVEFKILDTETFEKLLQKKTKNWKWCNIKCLQSQRYF